MTQGEYEQGTYSLTRGPTVIETRFIPCPAGPRLEIGFRQWERWVNADNSIHLLVKTALAHYQFETSTLSRRQREARAHSRHPPTDSGGAIHYPNLALSAWLEEHGTEYRDGLAAVSATGDFDSWVRLLARAVAEQAERERTRRPSAHTREELVNRPVSWPRGLAIQITEDLIGFRSLEFAICRNGTVSPSRRRIEQLHDSSSRSPATDW